MSREQLLESLRRKGDQRVHDIWQRMEQEAARLKAEADQQLATRHRELENAQGQWSQDLSRPILLAAERKARQIAVEAKRLLVEKLFEAALEALAELRDERTADVFSTLVDELPTIDWYQVMVNPQDRSLAEKHFAQAEIIEDPQIVGGLEAVAAQGGIRVNNTLEKRLIRGWPDIFPGLLQDLLNEGDKG